MRKLTTEEVIERFKNIHGDRYDYSKTVYTGAKNKMMVTCLEHGNFTVILDKHVNGSHCPKCVSIYYNEIFKKTTENFINESNEIHRSKYNYSKIKYINNKTKVTIICPEHGEFEQRSGSHLEGYGCPICKESQGEKEIRIWLKDNNVNYIPQHRFGDCKNIYPLPFDFYLPELNMCIEYNGEQHYKPNHFFVTNEGFIALQCRDQIKLKYCNENKIRLIIIKYSDNILSKLLKITI